jgi:hypothetical protein
MMSGGSLLSPFLDLHGFGAFCCAFPCFLQLRWLRSSLFTLPENAKNRLSMKLAKQAWTELGDAKKQSMLSGELVPVDSEDV